MRSPVEESLSAAKQLLSNDGDIVATFNAKDGTCRSKLPRFNKSRRPRSGVKSLTKSYGGTKDYDKSKNEKKRNGMKENREPVHRARVQTFEIEYVLRDCNYSLWES